MLLLIGGQGDLSEVNNAHPQKTFCLRLHLHTEHSTCPETSTCTNQTSGTAGEGMPSFPHQLLWYRLRAQSCRIDIDALRQ
jgi:hypothetical protein